MVDRKKGCATHHRLPAAPLAVKRAEQQSPKQIFFCKRRESHGHHRVPQSQVGYLRHLLLRLSYEFSGCGQMLEQCKIRVCTNTKEDTASRARQQQPSKTAPPGEGSPPPR